jgi:glycosyltransferase involved in cell wall biosynthesis
MCAKAGCLIQRAGLHVSKVRGIRGVGEISTFAPLVSVAMITYNQESFITKAIESVLAQQTRFPIELVIGEDASTDGTRRHIEALRARASGVIRTLIRPTNIGMHRNLEGVLEECRGEFIAFLEGDDYWTSIDKLQTQVDILQNRAHLVGIHHPVKWVDALDREIEGDTYLKVEREEGTKELLEHNIVATASVLMRRDALPSLPDSFRKLDMRDWPMWVFASLRGRWLYLPKVMAAYRLHDGGSWGRLSWAAQLDGMIRLFDIFAAELPRPFSVIARQQLIRLHLEAVEEALACDRPIDAGREFRELVRLFPYCRMKDAKRLVSVFWRTLSPRTHRVAKQTLRQIRQNSAKKLP